MAVEEFFILGRGFIRTSLHSLGYVEVIREALKMWVAVGSIIILVNKVMFIRSVLSALGLIRFNVFFTSTSLTTRYEKYTVRLGL